MSGQSATIVDAIGKGVEQLISLGAMYVVVPGVLRVGCFPIYLTRRSSPMDGVLWGEGKNRGKKFSRRRRPYGKQYTRDGESA